MTFSSLKPMASMIHNLPHSVNDWWFLTSQRGKGRTTWRGRAEDGQGRGRLTDKGGTEDGRRVRLPVVGISESTGAAQKPSTNVQAYWPRPAHRRRMASIDGGRGETRRRGLIGEGGAARCHGYTAYVGRRQKDVQREETACNPESGPTATTLTPIQRERPGTLGRENVFSLC